MNEELIAAFQTVLAKRDTLSAARTERMSKDTVLAAAQMDSDTAHMAETVAHDDLSMEIDAFEEKLNALRS